jgi:neurofibromin 1
MITEDPTPEAQRGLLLVAKTLQTMANQVLFGDKEPYMKPMNKVLFVLQ